MLACQLDRVIHGKLPDDQAQPVITIHQRHGAAAAHLADRRRWVDLAAQEPAGVHAQAVDAMRGNAAQIACSSASVKRS